MNTEPINPRDEEVARLHAEVEQLRMRCEKLLRNVAENFVAWYVADSQRDAARAGAARLRDCRGGAGNPGLCGACVACLTRALVRYAEEGAELRAEADQLARERGTGLMFDTYSAVRSLLTSDGIGRYAKARALRTLLEAAAADPFFVSSVIADIEKAVR